MKLSGREAARHFADPDRSATATLIYGQDAMRVALKRQELIASLIGKTGEEEMRLERIPASDLRKSPALLIDAMKAQGFFPGPRAVFVEDANENLSKTIIAALTDWQKGDAHIVVTAGSLTAKSGLRKTFESHRSSFAIGIYNDPPTRDEIEADLRKSGLANVGSDAMADLTALSRVIDPGDFRQTIEKLSLYKLNDTTPVTADDILACAPLTTDAALDDVLNIVAEGRTAEIGPVMQKLTGQGVQPVGLCIGAMRHYRTLHAASCDPGGPSAGLARARPPVFGPRRDRMTQQARHWGLPRLELALQMLTDTDLQLRSAGQRAPQMALVERMLIRLAMLANAKR
jgi:DNA polymerase-3 subunit delta